MAKRTNGLWLRVKAFVPVEPSNLEDFTGVVKKIDAFRASLVEAGFEIDGDSISTRVGAREVEK